MNTRLMLVTSVFLLMMSSACVTRQKSTSLSGSMQELLAREAIEAVDLKAQSPDGAAKAPDWLRVGEVLRYKLYWGVIAVGDATLSTDWVKEGDRTMLRITAVAKTGPFVRKLYPVDDYVESIVDPATLLPVQYRQVLNEGRKHRTDRIVFDHSAKRAVWRDDTTDDAHVLMISDDTRDLLSYIYTMRGASYAEKTNVTTRVIVDEKLYELTVKAIKDESIKIKGIEGLVPCFVAQPKAKFGEVFSRKGVVHVWCSKDKFRLCAKMTAFLPFADFKAKLSSFTRDRAPVTGLDRIEIPYDLLQREDIPIYEADRDIYEQFVEQKKGREDKLSPPRQDDS